MDGSAQIAGRIREFVEGRIGRPVGDDEKYFETGAVSSMFGLQVISHIEQAFGLTVDDDDLVLDNFDSIASLTAFVQRKR
jgi:acyl carrier protein